MTRRELAVSIGFLGFVAFGMLLSYFTGRRYDVLPGVLGFTALAGAIGSAVQLVRSTVNRLERP